MKKLKALVVKVMSRDPEASGPASRPELPDASAPVRDAPPEGADETTEHLHIRPHEELSRRWC